MNTPSELFSTAQATDSYQREALILSLVPGIGPRLFHDLVAHFGTAAAVLGASRRALEEVLGISSRLADAILDGGRTIDVSEELARCAEADVKIATCGMPGYPASLVQIPDPPPVVYVAGNLLPQDTLAVALVGTRHPTLYGLRQAKHFAGSLARAGFTIVSGLARGIDAATHQAALDAGGRTIAVLASGLQNIYPPEHKELAADIALHGALLCEGGLQARPARGLFPRRNRIISGLSLGLVVVEAGKRSGALSSARHAMEQNREVMAVPGHVDSRMSQGCHALLRDGATLIESPDDIIDALGPLAQGAVIAPDTTIRHPAELQLNEQEALVLRHIDTQATSIDAVVSATGLAASRVLATMSVLEMRRLIRRLSGQYVARC